MLNSLSVVNSNHLLDKLLSVAYLSVDLVLLHDLGVLMEVVPIHLGKLSL